MQCRVRGSQHLAACEQIEWIALPVSDHAPGPFHPLSEITKGQIAGRVRKVFGKGDEIIAVAASLGVSSGMRSSG